MESHDAFDIAKRIVDVCSGQKDESIKKGISMAMIYLDKSYILIPPRDSVKVVPMENM